MSPAWFMFMFFVGVQPQLLTDPVTIIRKIYSSREECRKDILFQLQNKENELPQWSNDPMSGNNKPRGVVCIEGALEIR